MKQRIGIIQGRLSPRPGAALQAFPRGSWLDELFAARRLGFDFLEWVFEARDWSMNPLATPSGRRAIVEGVEFSGMPIGSVCADYFMVHLLSDEKRERRAQAVTRLAEVIEWTAEIGARRILLPILERASLPDREAEERLVESVKSCAGALRSCGVELGLEMEITGPAYAALIARIDEPAVGAYYDTGNSTAAGFDVERDIVPLLPKLKAVHVKDRARGGPSLPLGEGDTNFAGLFRTLAKHPAPRDFVLQHFFQAPAGDAQRSLDFVRRRIAHARSEAA